MEKKVDFTFKNYIVKDKVATPENPFVTNYGETFVEMTGSYIDWKDFEQWKQSHTYVTDCKEDGMYTKEQFKGAIWLYKFKGEWREAGINDYSHTFEEFKERCDIRGFEVRQFLEFKQPSKQAVETVEKAASDYCKSMATYFGDAVKEDFISGAQWQSTQFQEQPNELHAMLAKSGIDADLYNPLSLKIIEIKQSLNT
jgi:hypothetical protein